MRETNVSASPHGQGSLPRSDCEAPSKGMKLLEKWREGSEEDEDDDEETKGLDALALGRKELSLSLPSE